MDSLTQFGVAGFVGGLVLAFLFFRWQRPRDVVTSDPFDKDALSTDVINAAHIRVAGVGGLGLVAMAAVVALSVPRIGQPLAIGLVLGAVFAAALIVWRRRSGVMSSSGKATLR